METAKEKEEKQKPKKPRKPKKPKKLPTPDGQLIDNVSLDAI